MRYSDIISFCAIALLLMTSFPVAGQEVMVAGDTWSYSDSVGNIYNESVASVVSYEGYLRNNTYAKVSSTRPYLNQVNMSFAVRTDEGGAYNISLWSRTMGDAPLVYSAYGGIPLFSLRDYQLGYNITGTLPFGKSFSSAHTTPVIHPLVGSDNPRTYNNSVISCRNLHCVPFEETFKNGTTGTQEVSYLYINSSFGVAELSMKYALKPLNSTTYELTYQRYVVSITALVGDSGETITVVLFEENMFYLTHTDRSTERASLTSALGLQALASIDSAAMMELTYDPAYPVPVVVVQKTKFPLLSSGTALQQYGSDFVLRLVRDESTSEKSPLVGVLAGVLVVAVVKRGRKEI